MGVSTKEGEIELKRGKGRMKMRRILWKKVFIALAVALFTFLVLFLNRERSILEGNTGEKEVAKMTEKIEVHEIVQEGKEAVQEKKTNREPIPYYIPLDEIAQRLEYVCRIKHLMEEVDWGYEELDPFPEKGAIHVSFYVLEGNKILFLPEGKGNTEKK
jgi:hypothetical protein